MMIRRLRMPLELRWPADAPPLEEVRLPRGRTRTAFEGSPWFDTGPRDRALDFSAGIEKLIVDVVGRCPRWRHLDVSRILIGFTQAATLRLHGLQARVTPLRFEGGALVRRLRGTDYRMQRYFVGEREYLYLLTFCLPRFLDQPFEEKLVTLFHEMHHFGAAFDGDLRRHKGRCHLHTRSKHEYDKLMSEFAVEYWKTKPDPAASAFLRLNFRQLRERHGKVVGLVVPRPRLIPVDFNPSDMAIRDE